MKDRQSSSECGETNGHSLHRRMEPRPHIFPMRPSRRNWGRLRLQFFWCLRRRQSHDHFHSEDGRGDIAVKRQAWNGEHLQHDQLSQRLALKRQRSLSILSHIMDCQKHASALVRNSPSDNPSIKVTLQRTECVASPAPSLRNLNAGLHDLIKDWKKARWDVASPFYNSLVLLYIHRKHPFPAEGRKVQELN